MPQSLKSFNQGSGIVGFRPHCSRANGLEKLRKCIHILDLVLNWKVTVTSVVLFVVVVLFFVF